MAKTIEEETASTERRMRGAAAAAVGALIAALATPAPAFASGGIDGAGMSLLWALPFAGLLLSIATGPVLFPRVWESHYPKFSAFWAACVVVPLFAFAGSNAASEALLHTLLLEYLPFILLLIALFAAAGGIYVEGNLRGTPAANVLLLLAGTVLASLVGTTGASMVMIRPLIRANDDRIYRAHTVVFFIFLVSNIGGSLTPLGDPPLFVGFLKGVDFFWTTTHLFQETLFVVALVLSVFFAIDCYLHKLEERKVHPLDPTPDRPLRLYGLVNLALIGIIVLAVLMSAYWRPGVGITIHGVRLELQNIVRDVIFAGVAFVSMKVTPRKFREHNHFSWGPMREVAALFIGIFICIVPVIAMLRAGERGAFAPLLALVTAPDGTPVNAAYFWLAGGLSSFLDNAPTYLVFFELAGGDSQRLMTTMATTLAAISTGAVFMGANSYIGNAPNFMVYAIARDRGVNMPSFFGYMLWSGSILIPIFLLTTFVFF